MKPVDETVETISSFVNNMSLNREVPLFIAKMAKEHRILQQSFTKLCFAWIQHMASLDKNQYDLRSEASVKACQKIMVSVDKYDLTLPTI